MDSVEVDDWIDELISTDVSVDCTTEDCIDSCSSSCSVDSLSDCELVVREDEWDIDNGSNKRCKCRGNKRHVSVKTGTVKGTNFGYSTHAIDPQHIRTTQISGVLWQNAELERIGFSNLFETAYSVTVFYNKIYDDDPYSINKPLLIRAKDDGQQIHWFENIGSHANKRWRRLRQDELKEFPDENNYSGKKEFETKLKALSCRLFVAHRIHIDFDQNKGYEIDCEICSEKLEIKVQQDSVKDSEGYKKYNYSGEFSENSILVYRRRQLTFQKRLRYKTGYYLPIPVDKDNFNIVSAYYWKEDDQKKNPLLIEFFSDNGYSYWIENISSPDKNGNYKHDKWRALPWTERIPDELKGRLDLLNCIYNKVVQIKIGSSGDCHPKRHILHRNRISYGYSEDYGTDPVLFSHKYWNSEGTRKSLNISEIYVGSDKQNFRSVGPPFRDVKMLIAYVSPCDKDKPFLMCLEYENKNYKWYQKKNKQGYWEEYEGFPDKRTPGDVKHQLGGILDKVRQGLGIGGCDQQTGAEGIQLDVNEVVPAGKSFHRYQYDSSSRKTPIFVTKAEKDPLLGFFKNTHKVYSKGGTFVLSKDLQNGGTIIAGSSGKISSVKEVEVYFWDANPKIPILLGITKKTQKEYTTYYGTLIQRWGPSQVSGMDKQQALDHQNCQKNNAIPIELTDPTDLERFKAKDNPSSCLKYKSVKSQKSLPSLPSEAVDYKVESYEILDVHKHTGTTRISRVTYNENPTNIVTTDAFVSQLRIYKWNNSLIPLLVEFKKSSGSEWHENLATPLLIYYTTDGHNKWFKDSVGSGGWTKAELDNKPEDYYKILDELNNIDKTRNPCKPPETGTSAALAGVGTAAVGGALGSWAIFGASSAPIAGAGGITGFAYWLYKRSKGDPWVRQI
ncbi:hypothetical protein BEWA_035510 [Theileria equi strain WA]|uniref:Uncharacterized protein n=1 Tax=Theileria equi strain WA TaxID=1537102 RepID=L1LE37_THEEQ|nr:hypothetical protein BEWA_035510 [Theileria equi strain WA]EKX73515.1 hypothetical protein BEWA_035510 [Theileria equi strain WA]|eukprot:XP_004832967.1 hypothetical protein BEWA_035510 [Theileria equi strain WA]